MKKIIAALMAVLLLTAMTAAEASLGGTSADPLITRDYLEQNFAAPLTESLKEKASERLQAAYDLAAAPYGGQHAALSYTLGQERFDLAAGGTLTVAFGGSVTPLTDGITLTVESGEVVDVRTGAIVPSGTALVVGQRVFSTEDTMAVYAAPSGGALMLDGPYIPGAGVEKPVYADVSPSDWYASQAKYAREMKLFRDWDKNLFRPQGSITRAEIIYAMWRAADSPATDYTAPFTDVKEDWYAPAVNWAASLGVLRGVGNDRMDPDTILDRNTIVTMLFRAMEAMGRSTAGRAELSGYIDAGQVPDWASTEMSWAVANQVIRGTALDKLAPLGFVDRAQTATLLQRLFA